MRLEEYLGSLPGTIMSGDDVQLPERALRDVLDFLEVGPGDVFYHLGCGRGEGVRMAAGEYKVDRAVGVDSDAQKIAAAKSACSGLHNAEFVCTDVHEAKMDDATAVLFWFADEKTVSAMTARLAQLQKGCKVATIGGPLPGLLPDGVRFPYVLSRVPFRNASGVGEQIQAVFGVRCVDFVTAWEHAELYIRAIERPDSQNNRFVTIIHALVMWINAKNMGVACGEDIPESIKTYMGILENFYNIDCRHLLK